MRDLLKSLKLIREFETRITIHKNEFTERLKSHVKTGDPSPLFSGLEIFSTDKREYIGEVNYDGFKFRRRRRLFEKMCWKQYEITPCSRSMGMVNHRSNISSNDE